MEDPHLELDQDPDREVRDTDGRDREAREQLDRDPGKEEREVGQEVLKADRLERTECLAVSVPRPVATGSRRPNVTFASSSF